MTSWRGILTCCLLVVGLLCASVVHAEPLTNAVVHLKDGRTSQPVTIEAAYDDAVLIAWPVALQTGGSVLHRKEISRDEIDSVTVNGKAVELRRKRRGGCGSGGCGSGSSCNVSDSAGGDALLSNPNPSLDLPDVSQALACSACKKPATPAVLVNTPVLPPAPAATTPPQTSTQPGGDIAKQVAELQAQVAALQKVNANLKLDLKHVAEVVSQPGRDGRDGKDGAVGPSGPAGAAGPAGEPGRDAVVDDAMIARVAAVLATDSRLRGETGAAGAPGEPGAPADPVDVQQVAAEAAKLVPSSNASTDARIARLETMFAKKASGTVTTRLWIDPKTGKIARAEPVIAKTH